jgi:hypothetical protein
LGKEGGVKMNKKPIALPKNEMKQQDTTLQTIKDGTANISIDEMTPHFEYSGQHFPTTWKKSTYCNYDFRYTLGKRLLFKKCPNCYSRLYLVVEEYREVTKGKNEKLYVRQYIHNSKYGVYCDTCGFWKLTS